VFRSGLEFWSSRSRSHGLIVLVLEVLTDVIFYTCFLTVHAPPSLDTFQSFKPQKV
jgi:hypothetical protein